MAHTRAVVCGLPSMGPIHRCLDREPAPAGVPDNKPRRAILVGVHCSSTAAPAWPTQPFCVELLRLHGASLTTIATAEGTRLQLELPVRGGAA